MIEFIPVRVLGRLSYCALFTHTIIQRGFFGIARDDIFLTDYYVVCIVVFFNHYCRKTTNVFVNF